MVADFNNGEIFKVRGAPFPTQLTILLQRFRPPARLICLSRFAPAPSPCAMRCDEQLWHMRQTTAFDP